MQLPFRALPSGVKLLQCAVLWLLALSPDDFANALEAPLEAVRGPVKGSRGVSKEEARQINDGKEKITQFVLGVLMVACRAGLMDFVDFLVDLLKDTGDFRPVESEGSSIALDGASA